MFGKQSNFRLFVLVITFFFGAVFFLTDPFTNKTTESSEIPGNVVSIATNANIVTIQEEEVAMGLPSIKNNNSNWVLIAIAVTLVNVGGAIGIVFMTSKDTSQV